jgi:hypothetical protein
MFKHKFKIGDKVKVEGMEGVIFTLGHAAAKGRKFTTCDSTKECEDQSLIGYQVHFGRRVKIVKESDLTAI